MAMTHVHTSIAREKRGNEGLVNLQMTHVLKTNEAGQLISVHYRVLNKIPIKGDAN